MSKIYNEKYVTCDCFSDEHTLRFQYMYSKNEQKIKQHEIYTSVFLNNYNGFFKRLWIAIKYVFGYKCKYGHWDCFIGGESKIKELQSFFNNIKI